MQLQRKCNVTVVSFRSLHAIRTRFVLDHTTRAVVARQSFPSGQQVHNWHVNSSHMSSVHLSREKIPLRDLELNLSQMLHLVSVHSKLTISIHKQLKRHVSFDIAQSDMQCIFDSANWITWWVVFSLPFVLSQQLHSQQLLAELADSMHVSNPMQSQCTVLII